MNHKNPPITAQVKPVRQPIIRRLLTVCLLFLLGPSLQSTATPGLPPYVVTVVVLQDNQIADGSHNDIVQVTVTDGGVVVSGISVNFKLQGASASNSLLTDGSGISTYPVNSTIAGPTTLSITVNGVTQIIAINFVVGPSSPTPPGGPGSPGGTPGTPSDNTYYIVTTDNSTANGTTQDFVKVHLSDQYGNPEGAGVAVDFTITGGAASGTAVFGPNGSTTAYTGATDANGDILLPITSTKVGDVIIHAKLSGVDVVNSPQIVHFVVGVPSPAPPGNPAGGTYYIVTTDNRTADGSSQDFVKVHLSDAFGNAEGPGISVDFTVTGGSVAGTAIFGPNSSPSNYTGITDANGDIFVPITSTKVGDLIIEASLGGIDIVSSPRTVHFVVGVPSANPPGNPAGGTYYIVTADNMAADGSSQDFVKVHLTDAFGNPEGAGISVVFTITGGAASGTAVFGLNGSTTSYTGITDGNGDILVPLTSMLVGDVIVQATLGGINIVSSPQTVHFVAGTPSPNPPGNPPGSTFYIVTTDNMQADGNSANIVAVHLSDQFGNTVGAGISVVFTVTGGIASGTAMFQQNGNVTTYTGTTDANGNIIVPITSTKVGDVIIEASLGGIDIVNSPRTVHFVIGAPSPNPPGAPAGGTYYIVTKDNAIADNVDQDLVRVHISDAFGNAEGAGISVIFTITGGVASGTANFQATGNSTTFTGVTDANGDIIVPIVSTKTGDVVIHATLAGADIVNSPQTVHFVAGAPVPSAPLAPAGTGTELTTTQNFRLADGVQIDSVKAHITDAYGNAVAGAFVTFSIQTTPTQGTATGGAQLVGTVTLQTDQYGNIEIPITSTVPGTVYINGSLGGVNIDGSFQTVTFDNAPDVHNPATQLIVVVYEAIANGQGTTVVKAHVVDLTGNPIGGQDVTFAIDSGSAQINTANPVQTDANGDAFITLSSTKAGYVLITATVDGQQIIFGSPARVKFVPINIYVPRVFTPNNDGTNDLLKPILVGIANFHYFSIYNRWGNLIFTTQDPTHGWDGTFKGVAQPVETYLWIAEGIDTEGNKIVQKGMVSLVR